MELTAETAKKLGWKRLKYVIETTSACLREHVDLAKRLTLEVKLFPKPGEQIWYRDDREREIVERWYRDIAEPKRQYLVAKNEIARRSKLIGVM